MKKFLVAFLLAFSFSAFAADQAAPLPLEQCQVHAPYGFMASKKQNTSTVCRTGYVLEHDNLAKIPVWVSWSLTPEHTLGCLPREDAFAADLSLPATARAYPKDYAKSGYDTGHLANDGDFRWNAEVSRQSFILSNMTPQLPEFNRGIWKKLEDTTRGWAISRQHTLIIYAGSIYDRKQDSTIGVRQVTVPHAFFKIIIDTETNEVQPFLFKHEGSSESLQTFLTSVAEIQRQSGLVIPLPTGAKISKTLWETKVKSAVASKKMACAIN